MSAIIEAVGQIFSAAMGWVGTIAKLVMGGVTNGEGVTTYTPNIITFFAVLGLVGLGVGLFRRLINVN